MCCSAPRPSDRAKDDDASRRVNRNKGDRAWANTKRENARLRLVLRELRHRCCNQWDMLVGLADMECQAHPQDAAVGSMLRLRATASAFAMLNRTLDSGLDVPAGDQAVCVHSALESMLAMLKIDYPEKNKLHFTLEVAWLPEQPCANALMLICAELVYCNAVKYGGKTTQVTFRAQADQGILEVRDDGPGFPAGFRVEEQARKGLQLVEALCRFDLKGQLRCQNDTQGGVVTVSFPLLVMPSEAIAVPVSEAFCFDGGGASCFDMLS